MKIKKHLLEDIKEAKESIMEDKKLMKAMKKQGPKAKLDESLGMRRGKEASKTQSYKARRDESIGAKKAASAIKKK